MNDIAKYPAYDVAGNLNRKPVNYLPCRQNICCIRTGKCPPVRNVSVELWDTQALISQGTKSGGMRIS